MNTIIKFIFFLMIINMSSLDSLGITIGLLGVVGFLTVKARQWCRGSPPPPPVIQPQEYYSDSDNDFANSVSVNGLACCSSVSASSPICKNRKGCGFSD